MDDPTLAGGALMRSGRRTLRIGLLVGCAALAAALAIESWQLARSLSVNRQLAQRLADSGGAGPAPLPMDNARLWIVAARVPARAGHIAEAAALLRRAADNSPGELRQVALYDLGNLYLREALRVQQSGADASALPLLELAKESYRSVLLERPDLWDAKFNLELALRVAPDLDPDEAGAAPIPTGERAVTTMRAFTLGLP
jgi:mxaK protein